jgi:LacI family transcriptional regulator
MQCRQLDQLHNHTLDGLIIYPDATNITRPSFIDRLNTIIESGTPVVLVDRNIPGVNTLAVVPDSEEGMCQLTRHMLMHGLSRFAVITWGPEAGVSHETRWAGFQRAMVEANLEPEPVLVANVGQSRPNEVVAREVVTDWLEKYKGKRPFDGIICFHDNMAMGAYLALQQAGLRVPEDMALGSFDNLNLQLYEAMGLSLTTVNQPVGLIGDMAARMLIEHLDNRMPLDAQCVKVRCDLIIRTSCGCLHTTI